MRSYINSILSLEKLEYTGGLKIMHHLSLIESRMGTGQVKDKITRPCTGLKIAPHYSCHSLRPSGIMEFDNPLAPALPGKIIALTGAHTMDWPEKTECCGAPLFGINQAVSRKIADKKIAGAKRVSADFIGVSCPWCYMQFQKVQELTLLERIQAGKSREPALPAILYIQLLGLATGLEPRDLGLGNGELHPGILTAGE
ncbi:MAG: hypothetical protein HQK66_02215 [Desulfamplus sp.]|nr:hypothetical protein [Desulfamplus sp.]